MLFLVLSKGLEGILEFLESDSACEILVKEKNKSPHLCMTQLYSYLH